jgi:chitinase
VVVNTSNAGCTGTSICNGLTVNVTTSTGSNVASFVVPTASLGGSYTQEITGLTGGSKYTVAGTTISSTTVTYTPSATPTIVSGSVTPVTIKYDKTSPVISTGSATISLANLVSAYTGDLQVQILNTKAANAVVNSYTIKQGASFATGDLPVTDSTHAYVVKMTTGIADPLQGSYYIESGLPTLAITAGNTTSLAIPMKASTIVKNNVTVTISGLSTGDTASTTFSDAANKYSYVNATAKANGSTVYKVESSLNFGVAVNAAANNYEVNPITSTGVVNTAKTISAGFVVKTTPVSTATYDYVAPFKDYNNKIVLSVQGLASGKSLSFASNFQQKSGWGYCFGQQVDNLNFITTPSAGKYITTVTPKDSTKSLDLTQSCDIMGTDSANAVVLTGVVDPIVYAVTVDGSALGIKQPCADTGCKDPGNGFVNAGYYAQWSVWGRQYNPAKMPFNNINDVIYAFIGFDKTTGNIMSLDASADSWGLSAVSRAMLQYPYMKAHLSFGGWTNNGITTAPMFEQLASSQASMNNFTTQAIALMRKTGFSGIDIDWEWWSDYNNNVAPAKKMLTFYQTLRTALDKASKEDGKKYTLTIAVNGGSDNILALESSGNPNSVSNFWAQVGGLMDYINVMNYDYHGSFDVGPAYFQANYDFSNIGTHKVGKDEGWSIKSSMENYIAHGVPAKKLVAGIPLYARTMTVSSGTNGGLFQTVTGAGFGDYENGILDYKCIVNPVNNPATGCGSSNPIAGVTSLAYYNSTTNVATFNQYGKDALQPWAYSASTNSFVTYDDQWSAVEKAKAVKASGLGGTMYWELDGDAQTPSKSIIQAVKDYYNQ